MDFHLHQCYMIVTKKIKYIPASISLLGILCFLLFFENRFSYRNFSVLTLNVPDEQDRSQGLFATFSVPIIEAELNRKKLVNIALDGDTSTDNKKIELIRYEARRLQFTNDTNIAICVTLSADITYGKLVSLLNMMLVEKIDRYVLLKNNFIILGAAPEVKNTTPSIPYFSCGYVQLEEERNYNYGKKVLPFITVKNVILIVGWLSLVIFSFRLKRPVHLTQSPSSIP